MTKFLFVAILTSMCAVRLIDWLLTEFTRLLSSFHLNQLVDRPTHLMGHTLDLIISYGLSISLTEISETAISDHFPVIVEFPILPSIASRSSALPCYRRILTSSTAEEFTDIFVDSKCYAFSDSDYSICPDGLLSFFNSTCILYALTACCHFLILPVLKF